MEELLFLLSAFFVCLLVFWLDNAWIMLCDLWKFRLFAMFYLLIYFVCIFPGKIKDEKIQVVTFKLFLQITMFTTERVFVNFELSVQNPNLGLCVFWTHNSNWFLVLNWIELCYLKYLVQYLFNLPWNEVLIIIYFK